MEKRAGTFIVIEGTDGSGKSTQFALLRDRLQEAGYQVATFDFPQYSQPSSYFVKEYLNGKYGAVDEVGPYTSSLFYALDRFEAAPRIREALAQGKVVLCDRFAGSGMAHQGAKFANIEERRGFFIWLDNLEFEMLSIPRPDISFVLRVPATIAQQLIDQRESSSHIDKKRDIHEADPGYLERTVAVYDDLAQLFPKDFQRIDCVRGDKLLDVETIQSMLREKIMPLLPPPGQLQMATAAASQPQTTDTAPLLTKDEQGAPVITEAGYRYLADAVTNTTGNVYAFTDKLSPATIAAAMARLSRRGDDLRVTLLDEFATAAGKDQKLLKRIITAYGDDSVQQLTAQHIVVENASRLVTKKLEWGRLAAYLEQSTRYIYYDKKGPDGRYQYFVPEQLPFTMQSAYRNCMDEIFGLYSQIVHALTQYITDTSRTPASERDTAWKNAVRAQACDAARMVLPTATTSTTGIFASGQALESLIMHLLSDPLPEAQTIGQQILAEARKVAPAFLERADLPERGGAWSAYRAATADAVHKLATEHLPSNHADQAEAVQLVNVWPRNELDLVPDMLYEHSNLPLKDIQAAVADWPYDRRLAVFEAYIGERLNRRHKPGRALEKAHYSWDIVCDYSTFYSLQRHRLVDDLAWQELTPRYGYEVPQLIEDAGLSDAFETCFDISLKLHSLLQSNGHLLEAQYAVLNGHRLRWKVTYNAREAFHLHELRTSPQGHPAYRKLVQQMHQKLCEVHPLLGEAMQFVNQDEDPALTRLAAERAAQFKLARLDQHQ